jgi:cytochrome P450
MASTFRVLGDDLQLQQLLRAERHRIPDFIEETLRIESPVKVANRLARSKTAIGGVPVPAGTVITVGLGAANRDPRRFEAPDDFRLGRPNVRDHIAFSRGVHACPGAPLARSETRITLERFLDRTAGVRISEGRHGPPSARHYEYEPTYLLRGLSALHIEFIRAP